MKVGGPSGIGPTAPKFWRGRVPRVPLGGCAYGYGCANQTDTLCTINATIKPTVYTVQVSSPARRSVYLVSMMITSVSAVSTRRHLRSAGQGDLIVPWTRTVGFGPRSFTVAGPLVCMPPEMKVDYTNTRTVLKPAPLL